MLKAERDHGRAGPRHGHSQGLDRDGEASGNAEGRQHRGPHAGRGGRGRRGGPFDYGDLRLLVLVMLMEKPSHGYELMKTIEERFEGRYSPSPGLIYPTLAWLQDGGLILLSPESAGRKRYEVSEAGRLFLQEHQERVEAILQRVARGEIGRGDIPEPILAAMGELKRALRARLAADPSDAATVERIAGAIREAAATVGRM
ncbi:PadR family transcriptional regulator [Aurantimonas sp. VKM B-3413]|uniref:PadR family transcriptional regulator n=1 Tax=Aurantimonas sp. VKM B-3413 TaxID=2779401 RepID=UPI001E53D8E5|nr:PadR family transcriptional regulator [Aurantimonas sp. VKM B-3413]MCB8839448.1 PadR family transcriptional regulator [Aurantimonas sp. VKM B-3413]